MDPGDWIVVFFITLAAGAVLSVVWFGRKAGFERNVRLRELAARVGVEYFETPAALKFLPPLPSVQGWIRGRRVKLHEFSRGSGKSRSRWVAARVECLSPSSLRVSLRTQGPAMFEKFARVFGYKDIVIGDPIFDSLLAIEGNDEAFIKAAFIPEIRHRLIAFWPKSRGSRITVEQGEAVYEEMGSLTSERARKNLENAVPVLSDMAAMAEVSRH